MGDSVDNPYRAPNARVLDLQPVEERGPRPAKVAIAVGLLWLTLLLQAAALTFLWRLFRLFSTEMYVVAGVVTAIWALVAFFVAMIERGRNWARITYLVVFLLGLPFSAFSIATNYEQAPLLALSGIVQALLQLAAMVMLFAPPAGAWFRGENAS
jgi:hypothetical protein